jgi:hypothetical protein
MAIPQNLFGGTEEKAREAFHRIACLWVETRSKTLPNMMCLFPAMVIFH